MTRIIGGVAGRMRLDVPSAGTRPTSDKVREALFSSLAHRGYLDESRVLDLYAGSGAFGLEAASRGARAVALVDSSPLAAGVIDRNAKRMLAVFAAVQQPPPECAVHAMSVESYLHRPVTTAFDLVYVDPPYALGDGELDAVIALLARPGRLAEDALVLVERYARSRSPRWPSGWSEDDPYVFGDVRVWAAGPEADGSNETVPSGPATPPAPDTVDE